MLSFPALAKNIGSIDIDAKNRELGRSVVVDIHLEHTQIPDFGIGHTHFWPRFKIDPEQGELLLTEIASDSQMNAMRSEGIVAYKYGYEAVSLSRGTPASNIFEKDRDDSVRVDAGRFLTAESGYQPPRIDIRKGGEQIIQISAEGSEMEVGSQESGRLEFAERTVDVRLPGRGTIEVGTKDGGGTIQVPAPGPIAEETIKPVLKVENYGPVDVYARGGAQ